MPSDFWVAMFVVTIVFAAFYWLVSAAKNKSHRGGSGTGDGSDGDGYGGHHGSDCGHGGDGGGH